MDFMKAAACFHIRREGEESDLMTDYFPGYFVRNPTQLIKELKGLKERAEERTEKIAADSAPPKVYIQLDMETWCQDRINDEDIEYAKVRC